MGLLGSQASTKKNLQFSFKGPTFEVDFSMFSWTKKLKIDFSGQEITEEFLLSQNLQSRKRNIFKDFE
jgi:hypothetical protein